MELLSSYLVNLKIKIFLNLKDGDPLAPAARELSVADLSRDSTRSRGVRGGAAPPKRFTMFTSRTQPQIVRRTWEPWQPKGPALRVRVSPGVHPHRLSSTAQVWLGIPRAAPRCGAPFPLLHCDPPLQPLPLRPLPHPMLPPIAVRGFRFAVRGLFVAACC